MENCIDCYCENLILINFFSFNVNFFLMNGLGVNLNFFFVDELKLGF